MSRRLYDYILLPQQMNILFETYSVFTHEIIDSYIYVCDVCNDGTTKKTEFICVHIKKYDEPTIYSNSMNFATFMERSLLIQTKPEVSMKKKRT
jgi:hypothetical protein